MRYQIHNRKAFTPEEFALIASLNTPKGVRVNEVGISIDKKKKIWARADSTAYFVVDVNEATLDIVTYEWLISYAQKLGLKLPQGIVFPTPPSQNMMDGKEVRRALPVEVRKAIPVDKKDPDIPVQELPPTPVSTPELEPEPTPAPRSASTVPTPELAPAPTRAPRSTSAQEDTDLRFHKTYNKEPRIPPSGLIAAKRFLIQYYALGVVVLAAFFAFNSIRRMLKIARGKISIVDLSLKDIEASRGLDMSSAFGDPNRLLLDGRYVHPIGQFLQRWLVYFPLAWIVNIFHPLPWILSLPPAILFWFFNW